MEIDAELNGATKRGVVKAEIDGLPSLREPVSAAREVLVAEALKEWLRFKKGQGLEHHDPFTSMETLIDAIRSAIASDASDEARASGVQACRTILAALETKPGDQLVNRPVPTTPMQAVLTALSNTPPEQLLDLAISRLKAALPAGTEAPPVQSVRIPLLPVASLRGRS